MENETVSPVFLPKPIWEKLERLAQERGCTHNELLFDEVQKWKYDLDYQERIETSFEAIRSRISQRSFEDLWPLDPLEALMLAAYFSAQVEDLANWLVSEMNPEDLESWEVEVKRTGRSMARLISDKLFGIAEPPT